MSEEEFEGCRRYVFEAWGISPDDADKVELYHALRILRLQQGRSEPSFDDFLVSYRKLTSGS